MLGYGQRNDGYQGGGTEYLNINEKLFYKLLKEKKIPGTKVTGKWTFPRRLVDEWIVDSAKETIAEVVWKTMLRGINSIKKYQKK